MPCTNTNPHSGLAAMHISRLISCRLQLDDLATFSFTYCLLRVRIPLPHATGHGGHSLYSVTAHSAMWMEVAGKCDDKQAHLSLISHKPRNSQATLTSDLLLGVLGHIQNLRLQKSIVAVARNIFGFANIQSGQRRHFRRIGIVEWLAGVFGKHGGDAVHALARECFRVGRLLSST